MNTLSPKKSWYREPWPWLLMTGPAVVVVAGIFTAWLAYTRGDPLVTEDYYRKGLQVGHTLASNERAVALGLAASVRFEHDQVLVYINSKQTNPLPASIRVTLSHPTRAGIDQMQVLDLKEGAYRGTLHVPQSGHWLLLLEDDLQTWRLLGKIVLPSQENVSINAVE